MTRTVVVGGGIGGLAASIALRDEGVEAVVLERAPELSKVELGAGITLWCNAMLMLDRLGVGDEVRAKGAVLNVFEQRSHRGRLLSRWPLSKMASQLGAPVCGINRPDLHGALAAVGGSSVKTGSHVDRFEQKDGTVTAIISGDGSESGDALIGADGLESVVRTQLLGPAPLRHSGLTMWRANVLLPAELRPEVDFTAWWGPGAKFVVFRSGPERTSWEGIVTSPPGLQDPPGEIKRAVHDRFADFVDPVHPIIEATDESSIFRTDVFDRPPDKEWGQGHVTLLGDAAHPMTFAVGQGAAQALEDAVDVAHAISGGSRDLAGALRAYEQRRIPRAGHFQSMAWKLARAGALDKPPTQALRNTVFQVTAPISWRMQVKDMKVPI
jgi:2-polyprenyl-6-methoxyphenol hydroxylase-like FAD-dependent oxidoreductase